MKSKGEKNEKLKREREQDYDPLVNMKVGR